MTYGAAAGAAALFFTSGWVGQSVLKYVPGYGSKYDEKRYDWTHRRSDSSATQWGWIMGEDEAKSLE